MNTQTELVSKEAWPLKGIDQYQRIEDGPWGYLLQYSDNRLVFDGNERPSDQEILDRWGSRLIETNDNATFQGDSP